VDGHRFFAERRLLYQARLAERRGLLGREQVRQAERLAARLPELIPEQPASLIHGDLWSGNTITDAAGNPALIDPAAYYGWAEAELAMTALFGAFPAGFYQAYAERRTLEPGFRQRFPIYNLYHLFNHLNLFGGGYRGEVLSILRHYTG
jgi:fructosamine-3-kinase